MDEALSALRRARAVSALADDSVLVVPSREEIDQFGVKAADYPGALDRLTAQWFIEGRLTASSAIAALLHMASGIAIATGNDAFMEMAREVYAAERRARSRK